MKLGLKIKTAREEKGLTQNDLVKISGVSRASLQLYEADKGNITLDNLEKIANALDYEVVHFLSSNVVPQSKKTCPPICPSIEKNMSPNMSLNNICEFIENDSPLPPTQSNNSVRIPVYDEVYASAGQGFINDEHITQHIELDKGFLRSYFGLTSFLDLSIITARGDSMLPAVPENCQIIVQKGTPREGQICVTRIDDELYVKRLQKRPKYKLISDNKSYDDIELEGENYEILGIVVGLFQKIP